MKILYLTDSHWRNSVPRYRTDDILVTQQAELNELLEICNKYKPDVILHGGDVFHSKFEPHSVVSMVMEWTRKVSKPIYAVLGNHCLEGYNVSSLSRTALGTLCSSGYVTPLIGDIEFPEDNLIIRGIEAHTDPTIGNYRFSEQYKAFTKIVVTHNYLSDHELPFQFMHTKDVKTNSTFVLSGHLHESFDYFNGKTRFINPGALSKWEIDKRDNKLQVILIDTNSLEVTYIPLQTNLAQWDLQAVQEEYAKELNLNKFVDSLESTEFESLDIEAVVRQAALQQGITSDILELGLQKIRQAKEVLK
jgi:DNA repair exonuclease SbcCD nuclease subunit